MFSFLGLHGAVKRMISLFLVVYGCFKKLLAAEDIFVLAMSFSVFFEG